MAIIDKITLHKWFCPNCRTLVGGTQTEDGSVKATCPNCYSVMVRRSKGRRHDTIEIYAPKRAV